MFYCHFWSIKYMIAQFPKKKKKKNIDPKSFILNIWMLPIVVLIHEHLNIVPFLI